MNLASKFSNLKVQTRKVWALSLPYFKSKEKWKAHALLAAIVALANPHDWRGSTHAQPGHPDQ